MKRMERRKKMRRVHIRLQLISIIPLQNFKGKQIAILLAWMSAMRIEKRKDVRETMGHALACIGRVFIEREG